MNEKHIKLRPHAAAASGISSGVERVALDFVDKVLDPNLEESKRRKDRSRSATPLKDIPPGSPWGVDDPAVPAAEGETNVSMSTDEPTMNEVVSGRKGGAQWPNPGEKASAKAADPRVKRAAAPKKKTTVQRPSIVPNSAKG